MRRISSVLVLLFSLAVLPSASATNSGPRNQAKTAIIDATIISAPSPVAATDERNHLVYEILIQNPRASRVRLDRAQVRDAAAQHVFQHLNRFRIKNRTFRYDRQGVHRTRIVRPHNFAVMLMDVRLDVSEEVPTSFEHRFWLTIGRGRRARDRMVTTATTTLSDRVAMPLGPPLRGEDLAVLGCCSAPFAHRLALLQFGAEILVAQRYAIDFVQINDDVRTFEANPADNDSYFIYGAEAIAVAPGEVVATRDDMSENTPPNTHPGVQLNDAAGNFVTLDLGNGQFALYAHLQPGSVQVQAGDLVEHGEVLGLVGNSGNSAEPHLHFHLMDGPGGESGLQADGLTYVFDTFRLDGRIEGLDGSPPTISRGPARPPVDRSNQYLLTGDIVAF